MKFLLSLRSVCVCVCVCACLYLSVFRSISLSLSQLISYSVSHYISETQSQGESSTAIRKRGTLMTESSTSKFHKFHTCERVVHIAFLLSSDWIEWRFADHLGDSNVNWIRIAKIGSLFLSFSINRHLLFKTVFEQFHVLVKGSCRKFNVFITQN